MSSSLLLSSSRPANTAVLRPSFSSLSLPAPTIQTAHHCHIPRFNLVHYLEDCPVYSLTLLLRWHFRPSLPIASDKPHCYSSSPSLCTKSQAESLTAQTRDLMSARYAFPTLVPRASSLSICHCDFSSTTSARTSIRINHPNPILHLTRHSSQRLPACALYSHTTRALCVSCSPFVSSRRCSVA
jgi:hypothetical protein